MGEWKKYGYGVDSPSFIRGNDGQILHYIEQNEVTKEFDVRFKWYPIRQIQNYHAGEHYEQKEIMGVKYVIVQSNKDEARMESICAIKGVSDLYSMVETL